MKIKDKRSNLDQILGENYTRSSLSPRFWDTLIITIALAMIAIIVNQKLF